MRLNEFTDGVNGALADGVTVLQDLDGNFTLVTFASAGIYNIQFSAQMAKTGAGVDLTQLWLRQDGVNVPWTNTNFEVPATKRNVAAWNFMISAAAGSNAQLMWSSAEATMEILSDPLTTPQIPSLILTVSQIR
jgi:hypothetical protein